MVAGQKMEAPPTCCKGAGWRLHLAEMAIVRHACTRQPAEMRAQAEAIFRFGPQAGFAHAIAAHKGKEALPRQRF